MPIDRPTEPKILITRGMTLAGIAALQDFDVREDNLEWIVSAIYEAMVKACPSSVSPLAASIS